MPAERYIKVIIPLKLDWEPFYRLDEDEDAAVGDRLTVPFAGRSYIGVVSEVDAALPRSVSPASVKGIYRVHPEYGRISALQLRLWREVADYYMCTVGEVYKMAYPVSKNVNTAFPEASEFAPRPRRKPLYTAGDGDFVADMAKVIRREGGNALWLVPEVKAVKALEKRLRDEFGDSLIVWRSTMTPARTREAVDAIRSGKPYVLLGPRSALFLPLGNLGTVIVQDEQDAAHKQLSPSPRYNARDVALLLCSLCGAQAVLQSAVPSLETLHNCGTGKYERLPLKRIPLEVKCNVLDINAEARKRGMDGDIPRCLCASLGVADTIFYKPSRAAFPTMEQLEPQIKAAFGPDAFLCDSPLDFPRGRRNLVVFGSDALLGRSDFRADEKMYQIVLKALDAMSGADGSVPLSLTLTTREPSHPVFSALRAADPSYLLEERRGFLYPPYTRLVDILVHDSIPERASRCLAALSRSISDAIPQSRCIPSVFMDRLRLQLPRDAALKNTKKAVKEIVARYESEKGYYSHISFDVDPL